MQTCGNLREIARDTIEQNLSSRSFDPELECDLGNEMGALSALLLPRALVPSETKPQDRPAKGNFREGLPDTFVCAVTALR
jgi:hypothetical protein